MDSSRYYKTFDEKQKALVADIAWGLWQAYSHGELDGLLDFDVLLKIDGNDDPRLFNLACKIVYRIES